MQHENGTPHNGVIHDVKLNNILYHFVAEMHRFNVDSLKF